MNRSKSYKEGTISKWTKWNLIKREQNVHCIFLSIFVLPVLSLHSFRFTIENNHVQRIQIYILMLASSHIISSVSCWNFHSSYNFHWHHKYVADIPRLIIYTMSYNSHRSKQALSNWSNPIDQNLVCYKMAIINEWRNHIRGTLYPNWVTNAHNVWVCCSLGHVNKM
jgi:hypothetical protein